MMNKIKNVIARVVGFVDDCIEKFNSFVARHPQVTAFIGGFMAGEGIVHGILTFTSAYLLMHVAPGLALVLVFAGIVEIVAPLWMLVAWFRAYFA